MSHAGRASMQRPNTSSESRCCGPFSGWQRRAVRSAEVVMTAFRIRWAGSIGRGSTMRAMIDISPDAQAYFRRILDSQGGDAVGIRLSAVHPGTPRADARLEFCEDGDLLGDEWAIECAGFVLYVDAPSVPYLDAATIDFAQNATGGQLTIRAPKIKGEEPGGDASIVERVRWLIDTEINPQLASHKGRVELESVDAD